MFHASHDGDTDRTASTKDLILRPISEKKEMNVFGVYDTQSYQCRLDSNRISLTDLVEYYNIARTEVDYSQRAE